MFNIVTYITYLYNSYIGHTNEMYNIAYWMYDNRN